MTQRFYLMSYNNSTNYERVSAANIIVYQQQRNPCVSYIQVVWDKTRFSPHEQNRSSSHKKQSDHIIKECHKIDDNKLIQSLYLLICI